MFLKNKDETFEEFTKLCKKLQNEKNLKVCKIRSDHGGEFENSSFQEFCSENEISHEFSFPRAPI